MFKRYFKTRQSRRIATLQAENESLRRQLAIKDAEIETLSLCLARDRERIKAELAAYAKATAGEQ